MRYVADDNGAVSARHAETFATMTYAEFGSAAQSLAADWDTHGVAPEEVIAILGENGPQYAVIDAAVYYRGAIGLPLQADAGADRLLPIVDETTPAVLAVGGDFLRGAVDLLAHTQNDPKMLLLFDFDDNNPEHAAALGYARTNLASATTISRYDEVVGRADAAESPQRADQQSASEQQSATRLLIYTSGSTGTPKGAIYTDQMVAQQRGGLWSDSVPTDHKFPVITLNYLPLSHVAGRVLLVSTLTSGGTAYFTARPDMSTFFDDVARVRPTMLMLVPRVAELIYQRYQGQLAQPGSRESEERDRIRNEVLGGRVLRAFCGSAPLSGALAEFLNTTLGCTVIDGYGSTEAGPIAAGGHLHRPPVTDYKLVDVPELGYHTTDLPHPRGELLLKSAAMFPGYFHRPDITAEVFDDDGFYRTGDIFAELAPDELRYLDRRNNVLKLSQGEFVAISHLESVYGTSPVIHQIYLYGSSTREYLLAVVVPTSRVSQDLDAARQQVLASLQSIAATESLQPYEVPRDVIIEREPFTGANGLLSGVGKLARPALKAAYGTLLEDRYAHIESDHADQLSVLFHTADTAPVRDTVIHAARLSLGLTVHLDPQARFADYGGDSLAAVGYANLLTELFGVTITVGDLMSAASSFTNLATLIERGKAGTGRPTPQSVHRDLPTIHAAELTLPAFLSSELLSAATRLEPATSEVNHVLLTGANGYLGRFLCLEWLERLAPLGGTLTCIIRAADDHAAFQRLREVFDSGDAQLISRFDELAAGHLEVLAGDVSDPHLGLPAHTWQRLATDVDLIVHSAALVNHVLPYQQLFQPNVLGTAELIGLALTSRRKRISYLSTVGVADQVGPAQLGEDLDVREVSATRALADTYANGYGNSKWAGEVLLRQAHEDFGIPVTVFRSDMILAHRDFAGQLNVPDMFTRLLLSVIATGIAPSSFYQSVGDATAAAHYDGLPADFTAAALRAITEADVDGFHTYNVVNPHHDGISLDVIIQWLIDSGNSIARVDDYADWLAQFTAKLRNLPEKQRRHSVEPLIHAYGAPAPPENGTAFRTEYFEKAVTDSGINGGQIPQLTEALIAKYASDLRLLQLI